MAAHGHGAKAAPDVALGGATAAPAQDSQPQVKTVVAKVKARAFYQMAPRDKTQLRPALNYVRGRVITIELVNRQVNMVTVTDSAAGVYLEPQSDTVKKDSLRKARILADTIPKYLRKKKGKAGATPDWPARHAPIPRRRLGRAVRFGTPLLAFVDVVTADAPTGIAAAAWPRPAVRHGGGLPVPPPAPPRRRGRPMTENGSGAPRVGDPADVPRGVRALLHRIAEADRSLALLLGCLLAASNDAGVTSLNALAIAFRDHHLRLVRAEGRDAERESGRLSLDEVRGYLRNSLLPRLVREGVVLLPPDGIEAPDSQLTVAPNVWEELGGYRSELARVLLETGERPSGPIPVSPEQTVPGHSLLEADGLVKTYRRRKVVNDVALRLQQGEIVGLLGPNGAGKTTTFYMIVGLIPPQAGRIRARRGGHHRDADVPAGPARHRLSLAGAVGLPQAVRRGQHPGDPRDAPALAGGARRRASRSCSTS